MFSAFCMNKQSDGLFNPHFERAWVTSPVYCYGLDIQDDFATYCMGGEL